MTTAFGYRLRSHNDCNPIGLLVFNACDVIILQIACSIYVLSTLHASHHLYKQTKKTKAVVSLFVFFLARTNPLTSALLRLITWRFSALDLRLTAPLS